MLLGEKVKRHKNLKDVRVQVVSPELQRLKIQSQKQTNIIILFEKCLFGHFSNLELNYLFKKEN